MKFLLTMIFMVISCTLLSQYDTSRILLNKVDTINKYEVDYQMKAGSCASPDGSMQVIASPPPTWQYLSDNGYCHNGIATTNTVTMCFTFTPTTASVMLNGGFSESCKQHNFTAFNLYNSSCVLVSTSLNPTGLTPGQQYTWCVTMRAWSGKYCNGYTTFCPYWQPVINLPIELIEFNVDNKDNVNMINWNTASEINNDYFTLDRSINGYDWETITRINGSGNSTSIQEYHYSDSYFKNSINYYRLSQTDFDGNFETSKIISINNTKKYSDVIKIINYIGVEVDESYTGIKLYIYSNGDVIKRY